MLETLSLHNKEKNIRATLMILGDGSFTATIMRDNEFNEEVYEVDSVDEFKVLLENISTSEWNMLFF